MKIDPQLIHQHQRIEPVAAHEQSTWQLAWRRELEHAQQLIARTHGGSLAGGEAQTRTVTHDGLPGHAQASSGGTEAQSSDVRSGTPYSESVIDAQAGGARPRPQVHGALRGTDTQESVRAFMGAQRPSGWLTLTAEGSGYVDALQANTTAALAARLERLAWLPRAAHVSLSGKGVEVSVRDTELSEEDAARLLERLRREVRDAGFELVSLVVNGRSFTG